MPPHALLKLSKTHHISQEALPTQEKNEFKAWGLWQLSLAQMELVYSTFGEKMAKKLADVITCLILNAVRDEL